MNLAQRLSLVLLLLGAIGLANADLNTDELPSDLQTAIEENTKLVIESLSEVAGFTLGKNLESVEWLDGFIERSRDEDPQGLVDILGSYFGDAVIARYGGSWVMYDGTPAVAIQSDFVIFPFSNVAKQFENGEEDSIAYLYQAIEQTLDDHQNR